MFHIWQIHVIQNTLVHLFMTQFHTVCRAEQSRVEQSKAKNDTQADDGKEKKKKKKTDQMRC